MEILFNETMRIASISPFAGVKTDIRDVRIQIIKDFKLVYRIREEYLEVLKVWDTRQKPEDFNIDQFK